MRGRRTRQKEIGAWDINARRPSRFQSFPSSPPRRKTGALIVGASLLYLLCYLTFIAVVVFVALHFVIKAW